MKRLTRREVCIVFGCVIFVLANLGAVGANGRRRAKEAVCFSNELKWCGIWKSYVDDHDGYFPPRSAEDWGEPTMGAWPWVIRDYYRGLDAKMLLCPAASKAVDEGGTYPYAAWVIGTGDSRISGSYACNFWVARDENPRFWGTPYVAEAARVPLLLDGNWSNVEPEPTDEPPPYDGFPDDGSSGMCINRHSNGGNFVFLDFSVKKIGLVELWTVKWHREWPEGYPPSPWPEWMENLKDY